MEIWLARPIGETTTGAGISPSLSIGSGSCQPFSTSELRMLKRIALLERADLWFPHWMASAESCCMSSADRGSREKAAPRRSVDRNLSQSGCWRKIGSRSATGRNSDPGRSGENGSSRSVFWRSNLHCRRVSKLDLAAA